MNGVTPCLFTPDCSNRPQARAGLLGAHHPGRAARRVSRPSYLAFLREAYHHVRHTVPLLQA
jgi:hypothetical protein